MPFLKDSRFYHVKPTTISRMKKRLTNRVMQRCHSKGEPPTSTMALSPMRVPLEIPKSEVRYEPGSDIDDPLWWFLQSNCQIQRQTRMKNSLRPQHQYYPLPQSIPQLIVTCRSLHGLSQNLSIIIKKKAQASLCLKVNIAKILSSFIGERDHNPQSTNEGRTQFHLNI